MNIGLHPNLSLAEKVQWSSGTHSTLGYDFVTC